MAFHLDAPSITTQDDFATNNLGAGWTTWDGYALAEPGDVANRAQFGVTGSHLSISIPDGAEHNMWWLRHAQVTRAYEGSGIYETQMDTGLGNEQFGLIFQSAPGTFLIFMLYGHNELWGYVERFVTVNGQLYKTTLPGSGSNGFNTGLVVPDLGPYYLRVTVRDSATPANRYWNFQWSRDRVTWATIVSGALETSASTGNIGAIQSVGLFAGNQPPSPYSGIDARFDYYDVYPVELSVQSGDARADLTWLPVAGAKGYRVYRSTVDGGPYTLVSTVSQPGFVNSGLQNGVPYYYVVTSYYKAGEAVGYSPQVRVVPRAALAPPAGIPTQGLALVLDATNLVGLANNSVVQEWPDSSGSGAVATGSGASGPTFLSTGINGKPVVVFDGVDDYLQLPNGFQDFTQGLTAFAVVRPTVLQDGFKLWVLGNGAGINNVGLGRAGSSAGLQYFTTNSSNSFSWFNTSDALVAGNAAVFGVSQAGGAANSLVNAQVTVNAQPVGNGSVYVPPVAARTLNYVGRSYWQEGAFQGQLAEILIYNRELTATQRGQVHSYLDGKYNLSASAALPAPTSVQATANAGAITVSYAAVNGATGYRISRAQAASGPFQQIGTSTTTSYVDSQVTAGVTYYYVVVATNGTQESPPSAVASATAAASAPPLPAGVPAAGLAVFLDASTLNLSNGSAVSSWTDRSGQGKHAVGVSGPVFSSTGLNGRPAVVFDGVNDHFTLPSGFADFTAGLSLFIVAEPTQLQPGFKLLALGNGAAIDNIGLGRAGSTSGLQYFTNNSSNAFAWFNTNTGLTAGVPTVFGVYQPGGAANATVTAVVTVDGASVGSGSVYVPRVAARAVNLIGKSYWAEGYFQGRIAEVLLYNRQLSATERANVHAYLDNKYAL